MITPARHGSHFRVNDYASTEQSSNPLDYHGILSTLCNHPCDLSCFLSSATENTWALLAAATSWYEFYQDVVLVGHYVKEYPNLHAQYGQSRKSGTESRFELKKSPRNGDQSPDRVHVSDPEFFHK